MLSFLRKIKNLRFRKIGAKNAALFLINKKLSTMEGGNELGRIIDLHLDRPTKTMTMEVEWNDQVNSIAIRDYKFVLFKSKSFLTWKVVECQGADQQRYCKIFNDVERIKVPKKYMTLLEVIL